VLQPITGFRTGLIGGRGLETRYDAPVSYGIRRYELDHYLLQRAGAHVVAGASVEHMERHGAEWTIDGALSAPMLVGAGGHFCPVARALGGGRPGEPIVAAQEIELALDDGEAPACAVDPETPELYFTTDLAGYGWCFRKGRYLNVGFGRQGARDFAPEARRFIAFLRGTGRVPESALRRWQGHAYLLYRDDARRRIADGALLVGDAAGLAYAQSGEGIRTAIESGLLAAQVIVRAAGRYTADRLCAYERALVHRFGRPGRGVVAPLLPAAWTVALGRRLFASPRLTRHVLLDRFFLHRAQPPLVAPATSNGRRNDINVGRAQDTDVDPSPHRPSLGLR
jgi:flavin-dependent dehydrogenase